FQEVDRLLRRVLGDQPAGDAPQRVCRRAFPTGHDRKIEPADLVFAQSDLVGGERALQIIDATDRERHRRLAITEIADGLRVLETEKTVLERLEIDELLEQLAGFLEGLAGKAAILAAQRRFECRLAAD